MTYLLHITANSWCCLYCFM